MTHDDDFTPITERLDRERPTATALELDSVKQRVLSSRPTRSGLRARIALIAMLAFGMLFSTSGATLAISGFAGNDQAAEVQYGGGDEDDDGGVKGVDDDDDGAVVPETSGSDEPVVQAQRQVVQSSGDELPFTGFAAIPVLLLGVALLSGGLVLRRNGKHS